MGIARAQEHGVCVMGLRRSHHLGRVGHWAEQATAAGMISIHLRERAVQADRGTARRLRRALRAPSVHDGGAGGGRPPLVLDFATSAIALGKVRVAHNKGVAVPAGNLMDPAGHHRRPLGHVPGPRHPRARCARSASTRATCWP